LKQRKEEAKSRWEDETRRAIATKCEHACSMTFAISFLFTCQCIHTAAADSHAHAHAHTCNPLFMFAVLPPDMKRPSVPTLNSKP